MNFKPYLLTFATIITLSCTKESDETIVSSTRNPNSNNSDLPSSIVLKNIPSGTFTMGNSATSDAPEVTVTLSSFSMSKTEITNAEYVEFLNKAFAAGWIEIDEQIFSDPCGTHTEIMVLGKGNAPFAGETYLQLAESGGCTSHGGADEPEHLNNKSWIFFNDDTNTFELLDDKKDNWPVNWVKWFGANAFCEYYNVSLPSEAQWEYSARSGENYNYPTNDGTLDSDKANYNGETPGLYNATGHSVAVGSYPANPYGLHDMGGNVWEWCLDYYSETFYKNGATNPLNTDPGSESKRVRRGGSWNYHSATLLTYARASDFQNRGNNHFGFRIVKN